MDERDKYQNGGEISDIIRDILKNRGWGAKVEEHKVFSVWGEVVGDRVAKNSAPKQINRGALVVITKNPTWTQQLTMMKEKIIKKLNKRLGDDIVKEIRFIQGEIPVELETLPHVPKDKKTVPPSKTAMKRLKKLTEDIEDEELKEFIGSVLKKALSQLDNE